MWHVAGTKWGTRKYLDMSRLAEQDAEKFKRPPTQSGEPNGTLESELMQATAQTL